MEAHTPRSYNFCILTELVFEIILSFMGNQTLTKMQMLTGDHYPKCESDLARCCCKCENDNLTTSSHLCRECENATYCYSNYVTRRSARTLYGVKDFSQISKSRAVYTISLSWRITWCEYAVRRWPGCEKSRFEDGLGARSRGATRQSQEAKRRKEERRTVIAHLDPDFRTYIYSFKMSRSGKCARYTALERSQTKFKELKAALTKRGLPSEPDFQCCKAFIMTKSGDLDRVVDNMEEKHFLFTQTEYPRLSGDRIDADRHWKYPALVEAKAANWKKIKADLCVQYLLDNKGVTIPQKWENCRQRFEEVVSGNLDPKLRALYIYSGEAQPPAEDWETH
ncbi:hypothetical protein V7S43_005236 [Phytophthora oleae]|uniref:Myb-like domain-containing protein n=1 Tax=Phytophthora oleae TaxID=2107226 RepID=A0ABD3FSE5_9STRA